MATEILHTAEDFYIVASSFGIDERTRVLKHDDTFGVFNVIGDIGTLGLGDDGIYHRDTRFLSRMTLRLADRPPVLLSSTVRRDNALLTVDLTNADVPVGEVIAAPHGMLHLYRSKLLWRGACYERIRIHNYGHLPVSLPMDIEVGCDFADIFEVRGMERPQRGHCLVPVIAVNGLEFGYEGLDGRSRSTRIVFEPVPHSVNERGVRFDVRIGPGEAATYDWTVQCIMTDDDRQSFVPVGFEQAATSITRRMHASDIRQPVITTGNELFDRWVARSVADLAMLRSETSHGPYPYAGVPWFSTAFGRDGIITALETLWFDPAIARGVLAYLADMQAQDDIPASDAQPGKILHETRDGEMAAVGEVPFYRYYGSIDSTPLFVMLAGEYFARTGNHDFISSIWPNIEAALTWIDTFGDIDGDGFVEYARRTDEGLAHQGWKDSTDPVFHGDGTLAEPPIALCEVQAYVYAAKLAGASLASALGHENAAQALREQAADLQERFEGVFWCPDLETYGLALDGDKQLCRVRASNAGHCLFAGIAAADHAALIADGFLADDFFSGWGIRTVSADAPRYNPMSYHNGSVWPHDNALIAAGLARYGFKQHAARILEGLFESTHSFELHRLPELFCGFHRRHDEDPTKYPVACSPQAWAAGAVLMLIQACLGMEVRDASAEVVFGKPFLPDFLPRLEIRGLRVGTGTVDIEVSRSDHGLSIDVLSREGEASVSLVE